MELILVLLVLQEVAEQLVVQVHLVHLEALEHLEVQAQVVVEEHLV
jgi:hypothetical protein